MRRYPQQLALHTMTVLEEGYGGACTLFDFLPRDPTDAAIGARCAQAVEESELVYARTYCAHRATPAVLVLKN